MGVGGRRSARSGALILVFALLAACGNAGGAGRASPVVGAGSGSGAGTITSAPPAVTPSAPPPTHGAPSGGAALGRLEAKGPPRVIPVPASVAETQTHLVGKVDGEQVLLDASPQTEARPLVLVLHGLGQSGAVIRKQTGFTALGALKGFDVAYPDAHRDPAVATSAVLSGPTSATWIAARGNLATPQPAESHLPPSADPATPNPSAPNPSPAGEATTPPPAAVTPTIPRPSVPARSPSSPPTRPAPAPTHQLAPNPPATPPPNTGTRSWNAGSCCSSQPRDDVGYLLDVVRAVEKARWIDTHRVYVIGFSNGGMMALDAICSAPTVFAAAGSVSGPYLGKTCARPVWRHLAAEDDPIVPSGGGIPPGIPGLGIPFDWCGCSFPSTATEEQRFGFFASVLIAPQSAHTWPTPDNPSWRYDPENDLWNYVSPIRL